ncbi:MAG: hypothetical protein K5851_03210 [Lachnospiraceae bacterium]|nr:hypothetical protein [Lachnospiraceae bacterium]
MRWNLKEAVSKSLVRRTEITYKAIEYVLFGDRDYKETHPNDKAKIQAIEDATYLCVDQYNGNGKKELENLQNEKIPDMTSTQMLQAGETKNHLKSSQQS